MKKVIILLVIGILFPIKVHALTGNIEIQCDNYEVSPGSNIKCTVKGNNFSSELSSFHAELLLGDNLKLVSIEENSSWEGSAEGGIIDLYTDVNKSGTIDFVTFVIEVHNVDKAINTNISITDIKIGDSQFIEHSLQDESISVKITPTSSGSGTETEPDTGADSGTETDPDAGNNPDTGTDPGTETNPDIGTEPDTDNRNESNNIGNGNNSNTGEENDITNPSTGSIKISVVLVILFGSLITAILYKKKITSI